MCGLKLNVPGTDAAHIFMQADVLDRVPYDCGKWSNNSGIREATIVAGYCRNFQPPWSHGTCDGQFAVTDFTKLNCKDDACNQSCQTLFGKEFDTCSLNTDTLLSNKCGPLNVSLATPRKIVRSDGSHITGLTYFAFTATLLTMLFQ